MSDEDDKTSITYFMTKMTQEQFDKIMKFQIKSECFETGWSTDERYIINKIRLEKIQKMEEMTMKNCDMCGSEIVDSKCSCSIL